jgi:hypothetical protein
MFLDKLRAYGRIFTRPRYDGLPEVLRLLLKRPAILMGVSAFETALLASGKTDGHLKALASIKTSSLVGCPF